MPLTEKLKGPLWQHPYSALVLSAVLTSLFFPVAKAPRNIAVVALILFAVTTITLVRPHLKIMSADLPTFLLFFTGVCSFVVRQADMSWRAAIGGIMVGVSDEVEGT